MDAHGGGVVPVGSMMMWFLPTPPANGKWLICDGTPIPAPFTALISLIGANLPNLKGRIPMGVDPGMTPPAGSTDRWEAVGRTGGEARHRLLAAEGSVPVHGHTLGTLGVVNAPAIQTGGRSAAHTHAITINYWDPAGGWTAPLTLPGNTWQAAKSLSSGTGGFPRLGNAVDGFATRSENMNHNHAASAGTESSDHSHALPAHGHSMAGQPANSPPNVDAVADHNNVQPYLAVNYIIRAA
jgi:microcystin-dependent protein